MNGTNKQEPALDLTDLMDGLVYRCCSPRGPEECAVHAISADSRTTGPGTLFIACTGSVTDGHRYLSEAIQSGAAALIIEHQELLPPVAELGSVCVLVVDDTAAVLGELAARFYGQPASALTLIGITGTNGKTTVSYLLEHALTQAGLRVGVIGTVEYRFSDQAGRLVRYPAPFTTPDPLHLHRLFREMADHGVTHVVMEVSSHALQQRRLGPIGFSVALFTNLSQDHLDYHQSMEDYLQAKCLLFSRHLDAGAHAIVVLPADEKSEQARWAGQVIDCCRSLSVPVLTCGRSDQARLRAVATSSTLDGSILDYLDEHGARLRVVSPLVGRFNMDNLLAAAAALHVLGIPADQTAQLLATASGAPGRLQRVALADHPAGRPTVFVDYAHTPDALQNVLMTLTDIDHRRLYTVVGCGGDRDRGKRPLMGGIAAALSDVVIVTDDNPRREEPASIRAAVMEGVRRQGMSIHDEAWLTRRQNDERGCVEIADRTEAIRAAVTMAMAGDIILIAGKGHEQYQITGAGKRFFDDRLTAQQASLGWQTETIAAATGGRIICSGDPAGRFLQVATDSRTMGSGDIFVALRGERFDGHDYLERAVAAGAGCLVVADATRCRDLAAACVEVTDTLTALGDLAHWRRRAVQRLQNPVVVGLTGSCGKTTVKEMTAAIFEQRWPERIDRPAGRVLKTVGNLNNLVGLPLSLLPVGVHHCGIVLEMGMNQPGEIERLARIADPDIACITNIHAAHLAGLGSIEGVARAKSELFEASADRAVLAVNLDDDRVVACSRRVSRLIVGFSANRSKRPPQAEVWVTDWAADEHGHLRLTIHVGDQQRQLTIAAPGLHNAINAAAAAAIAVAAGIDVSTIVSGLESFRTAAKRMQTIRIGAGLQILNDTYNANPASMASALQTLANLPAGRRVALLGDMLELGESAEQLHEEVGRLAAVVGVDYLGLVGGLAEAVGRGAVAGGMAPERIVLLADKQRAVDWLTDLVHSARLRSGDWLLVKASRGIALDTVVDRLVEQFQDFNQ